jgi:glutamate 5-kinase
MDGQIRTWSGRKGKKQTIFPAAGTQRGFSLARERQMSSSRQAAPDRRALLDNARRLVVKVGTAVVCNADQQFDQQLVAGLAGSVAALIARGRQIVLVSSGAVALGAAALNIHRNRLRDAAVTRACAAVGQCRLMQAYADTFRPHGLTPAQILVTEDDFNDLERYKILRQTFERLLKLGAVPVVNENDTVTNIWTEKPAIFRDNDRLAALVMSKLDADALVLLSNVDGFLRDPHRPPDASNIISVITQLSPELRQAAQGKSSLGRGGMAAKLDSAEIAMVAGGLVVIANGKAPGVLEQIFAGENVGTLFLPGSRMAGKRRWLAFATTVRGHVTVNTNAARILLHGQASLLISGVTAVRGDFSAGQVIAVHGPDGAPFAKGIAECSSRELAEAIAASGERKGVLVRRENLLVPPATETSHA